MRQDHTTRTPHCGFYLLGVFIFGGSLVAQSNPKPSVQNLPLRIMADSSHDVVLVKVRTPGQKKIAAEPSLVDVPDSGLPGKVEFTFIRQVDPGSVDTVLLFLCHVENFPLKLTEIRTAKLTVDGAQSNLDYRITNLAEPQQLDILGPVIPWVLSDNGGAASFDVITGDAPASKVTVSATVTEKDGGQSIDGGLWRVCEAKCADGCSAPDVKDVNVPQHTRAKLWLCAPKPDAYGEFNGTLLVSALEYPSGHSMSFKVYATSSCRRAAGLVLLCLSVALAWYARTYMANRLTRDQALLGVAIQRQRAEQLARTVYGLQKDFSAEQADVYAYLNDLLVTKLMSSYIDAQLYATPSVPVPFQFSPRATQFTAFLNQVDSALNVLTIVVREGLQPVLELWQSQAPNHLGDFRIAVREMNTVYVQNPDLATTRRQVRASLDKLRNAIGGTVAAAAAAAAPRPTVPSVDTLLMDIRRISHITWMVICLLTVLAGWVVLIGKNPGFGKPTDLLFCVFWGFGLPITVQSLTPSSVINAFTGSTMRVSAVAA